MTCPKCKGEGKILSAEAFKNSSNVADYKYVMRPCGRCHGKGYLTPEEAGLEKF